MHVHGEDQKVTTHDRRTNTPTCALWNTPRCGCATRAETEGLPPRLQAAGDAEKQECHQQCGQRTYANNHKRRIPTEGALQPSGNKNDNAPRRRSKPHSQQRRATAPHHDFIRQRTQANHACPADAGGNPQYETCPETFTNRRHYKVRAAVNITAQVDGARRYPVSQGHQQRHTSVRAKKPDSQPASECDSDHSPNRVGNSAR